MVRSPFSAVIFFTTVKLMANFTTSFTFFATLPRLLRGSIRILVASSCAASVTFLFRFFFSSERLSICREAWLYFWVTSAMTCFCCAVSLFRESIWLIYPIITLRKVANSFFKRRISVAFVLFTVRSSSKRRWVFNCSCSSNWDKESLEIVIFNSSYCCAKRVYSFSRSSLSNWNSCTNSRLACFSVNNK